MPFDDNEQKNSKNFVIAMVLFVGLMFGFEYFSGNKTSTETPNTQQVETLETDHVQDDEGDSKDPEPTIETIDESMASSSRIFLENDHVVGSIDLNGGVLDSIILRDYKETTDSDSKNVRLLTPKNTEKPFYFSISYSDKTNNEDITNSTVWTSEKISDKSQSAVLKTQTQNGLVIERTVSLDDSYYIRIKDKVQNVSNKTIKLRLSSALVRRSPEQHNYAIVHEGLVGCSSGGSVEEIKYKDIKSGTTSLTGSAGWLGYTDLYWLCAITADKSEQLYYGRNDDDSYKISTGDKLYSIAPDSVREFSYSLYAGPKDIKILKLYKDLEHLDNFDMAIDFGWFFIITKPLCLLVGALSNWFSNMGFVILFLTLLFRVITYPLMKKSFVSAARMKEVQPKIAMLQKTYANDKVRMNQEMMLLYKKEKISPMSGCLPMLLQAPIFFCLYKIFFISIEMRHAPLFGWIHDLSAPDNVYLFNLFGLIDWTPPSFLQIGIWPIIMGLTMYLQQKLSTSNRSNRSEKTSEQKMQENMMLFMPVLFTYICASFPVAVVVYWTISNVFSMAQQYYVNKKIVKKIK